MRLFAWNESSSDQPMGMIAKTAMRTTAGATNAQPARCSEATSRLSRLGRRWTAIPVAEWAVMP